MDKKKKSGSMDYVDSDVLLNILSRAPTESVLECKLVCKRWGNLLKKKYFIDMHVRRQIIQLCVSSDGVAADVSKVDMGFLCTAKAIDLYKYESLYHGRLLHDDNKINTDEGYTYNTVALKEIAQGPSMPSDMRWEYLVGSCNGLVCLGRYHDGHIDPIYIFNPITGNYTYLPKFIVPKEYHPGYHYLTRGFGYVGSTNEYKVVRIYYPDYVKVGQVQVYTIGSSCGWRNKSVPFPPVNCDQRLGTFANETIYWAYESIIYGQDPKIHAFDLVSEEYRMVSLPSFDTLGHALYNFRLAVLGRKLCLFSKEDEFTSSPHIEIWTMKKADMNDTWSRDFSIVYGINEMCPSYADDLEPILLTKKNEVIFTCNKETLCCYDPLTETWRVVLDEDEPFDITRVIPHVNTLVCFEALGEKTIKTADASLSDW